MCLVSGRRLPPTSRQNSRVDPAGHFVDIRRSAPPESWGVTVVPDAIEIYAHRHRPIRFAEPGFDYSGMPEWGGAAWCDFSVLGCSVVWCLWPPEGEEVWRAELDGRWLEDAPAIWACFTRAFGTRVDLEHIPDPEGFFAGRGTLQMVAERGEALQASAGAIRDQWGGSTVNMLEEAGFEAAAVARLLIDTVPGFQDRPRTPLGTLPFDKLANLAVSMMAARSPQPITGLGSLPVFPDYMLPRVLRHHGVLEYEPGLAEAVDSRRLIPEESNWEMAIRWATVYAAEQLRSHLNEIGNPVTNRSLDYHLWSEAVLGPGASSMGEHHRTVSRKY